MIELRSATVHAACPQDFDLETLQDKMQEYIENGVHLGWLINPQDQRVEVYRQGGTVEVLSFPVELSGEAVLPEFTLRLS